jgi:hypothetical protein
MKRRKGMGANQLEQAIMQGAVRAHRCYEQVSGGCWLRHGPEHFVGPYIAEAVAKTDHIVYLEKSPAKIDKERRWMRVGRPPSNKRERFDAAIWYKATERLKAIVEIKLMAGGTLGPIRKDAEKVRKHLAQGRAKKGYLLVYTVSKGRRRAIELPKRLAAWAEDARCTLIEKHVRAEADDDWGWAFGLFRVEM